MKKVVVSCLISAVLAITAAMTAFASENTLVLNYNGKSHTYTAPPVNLIIDGTRIIDLEVPPIILEDYTMVPVRTAMEYMGAEVEWKAETSEIVITYEDTRAVLQINNKEATVNGEKVTMPIPPLNINGNTMIPLRFVADNLNFLVYWEQHTRSIYIYSVAVDARDGDAPLPAIGTYVPADSAPTAVGIEPANDNGTAINRNISLTLNENIVPAVDKSVNEMSYEEHPETRVTNIIEPTGSSNVFTIETSSAISRVEKRLLNDNRMYLDIYGAEIDLEETVYTYADNPNVASVRAAQNMVEPEKIVRVVFYLKDGAQFDVDMSKDRKSITVGFPGNKIEHIEFESFADRDVITITGSQTPGINIWPVSESRISVDVHYADIDRYNEDVQGKFASRIIAEQNGDTARIAIDLKQKTGYNVIVSENTAVVTLFSPTQKNIEYDYVNKRIVLYKTPGVNININAFTHTDNYNIFEYIITMPSDFSAHFGHGDVYVGDDRLHSFSVNTRDGKTSVTINEERIFAFNVYEDAEKIYIQPVLPKEKYAKIVILDAGHGGSDTAGAAENGLREKDINLDIVLRLHELLERDPDIKVYSTRLTDVYPSLGERVQFATENGDIFISIHNNSAPNKAASGTETFYYPRPHDELLGFSGQRMAEIINDKLVSVLGTVDRGVKTDNFQVISTSRIPSVLVEVGFISNKHEAALLSTSEYRTMAALAIYAAIVEIFDVYTPPR